MPRKTKLDKILEADGVCYNADYECFFCGRKVANEQFIIPEGIAYICADCQVGIRHILTRGQVNWKSWEGKKPIKGSQIKP